MPRDIYQIGIDAVKFLNNENKILSDENTLDEVSHLLDSDLFNELLDYNCLDTKICDLEYPCRCCGEYTELHMDLKDLETTQPGLWEDNIYCGKNQYCMP